jgi:SEC-C motif-containing protein
MKKYKKCCKVFHDGVPAPTAETLMRSRYTAFVLHHAQYIMRTTHAQNSDFTLDTVAWQQSILEFSDQTAFEKLTILDTQTFNDKAYVTFFAKLSSHGKDCSFCEKSQFFKVEGKWLYHSGVFLNERVD